MGQLASDIYPYAIAVLLPPAGLILGLVALDEERGLGLRLIGVALLAGMVWSLVLLG